MKIFGHLLFRLPVSVIVSVVFFVAVCEAAPPTPPVILDRWGLAQPDWSDVFGEPAIAAEGLTTAPGWDTETGTALSVDTNVPAFLNLGATNRYGDPNLALDSGTIYFWFQPNFTSVPDGGNGPTNWACLWSAGQWTSNAADSSWSVFIGPDGTNLLFLAQSNGSSAIVLNAAIDFDAGDWHNIALAYTPTNCSLYLEGWLVTNTSAISLQPTAADLLGHGMFVGSEGTNGEYQARGQFQRLEMYGCELSAEEIAWDYVDDGTEILNSGGSLPGSFSPDIPPFPGTNYGGGGGGPLITNQLPNPGTNLWLLITNTGNTVVVTLSNTIAGSNYLLLAAHSLQGPWYTNQSLLAAGTVTTALPVWLSSTTNLFFAAQRASAIALGTLKWRTFIGGTGDEFFGGGSDASPAIGPDGTIYITSTSNGIGTNNLLFAIDPLNGSINWSNNIFTNDPLAASIGPNFEIMSSPSIGADGTIYAGSEDGSLYAVSPSGTTRWSTNLGAIVYSSPAVAVDGTVYAGTDDPLGNGFTGLFAVTNGAEKWFFVPQDLLYGNGGDLDSSPAIAADGTVYFLAEDHRLYAVAAGGYLKWFLPLAGENEPDSSSALGSDGTIYTGSNSKYVYAVNPDGSIKWAFDVNIGVTSGYYVYTSPALTSDGTVYAGSVEYSYSLSGGSFFALNSDGTQKWVFTNTPGFVSSPALAADGTVYIGGIDGKMYAITTNGAEAWHYQTGGSIAFSSPAIGSDGTVYIASTDGYLYAFFGSAPLATNSPWPMFQHDPAHTGRQPAATMNTNAPAPFVYNGTLDGYGDFTFDIVGPSNSLWNVYASADLSNWMQVATNLLLGTNIDPFNGNNNFTDSSVSGISQRFYQLSNSAATSLVIGFINLNIAAGTNLVADQLYQVDDNVLNAAGATFPPMNSLNDLFIGSFAWDWNSVQSGTTATAGFGGGHDLYTYFYNPFFGIGSWSDTNSFPVIGDMPALPGFSIFVAGSASFATPFIGLIREKQVVSVDAGTNNLSATVPKEGAVTNVTGYRPENGDTIQLWFTNSQTFSNYTFSSGAWTPTNPVINIGQGFVLITTNSRSWTNAWSH